MSDRSYRPDPRPHSRPHVRGRMVALIERRQDDFLFFNDWPRHWSPEYAGSFCESKRWKLLIHPTSIKVVPLTNSSLSESQREGRFERVVAFQHTVRRLPIELGIRFSADINWTDGQASPQAMYIGQHSARLGFYSLEMPDWHGARIN